MAEAGVKLEDSWKRVLSAEFASPYMQKLKEFLLAEKTAGKRIFPKGADYFRALDLTPLDEVKVVISLVNIYKELQADLGIRPVGHGFLESWAKQGVLLLNSVLTVEEARAASHQGQGWEKFTDAVIRAVNDECDHVVFLLWGSYAQKKAAFVNQRKHLVLRSPHPSPLSAHNGFFGNGHFSKANAFLFSHGRDPIDWQLPETV
ncbi:MAG: uracil-DNA glycosylase [Rhizobium pusense]|nr:uracil-DNA glycosylase [Agrobacterium pusense]